MQSLVLSFHSSLSMWCLSAAAALPLPVLTLTAILKGSVWTASVSTMLKVQGRAIQLVPWRCFIGKDCSSSPFDPLFLINWHFLCLIFPSNCSIYHWTLTSHLFFSFFCLVCGLCLIQHTSSCPLLSLSGAVLWAVILRAHKWFGSAPLPAFFKIRLSSYLITHHHATFMNLSLVLTTLGIMHYSRCYS